MESYGTHIEPNFIRFPTQIGFGPQGRWTIHRLKPMKMGPWSLEVKPALTLFERKTEIYAITCQT